MKWTLLVIGCFAFLISLQWIIHREPAPMMTVGILQTASHPALDRARQSFKEHLQQIYPEPIQFIEQNGMGQMGALQVMAQNLHRQKQIALIFAIGTPALQVMASAEKQRPIVFAAVTDLSQLKLEANRNICGCSDALDPEQQVKAITQLFKRLQRVAIAYNPSESNSQVAVNGLKQALDRASIEYKLAAFQTVGEIPAAISNACRTCDIVLTPTDNLVATSMTLLAKVATASRKPVIASDLLLCGDQMASAAYGIDYGQCGIESANLALLLLEKRALAHDLPIRTVQAQWSLDEKQLRSLGIELENAMVSQDSIQGSCHRSCKN